MTEQRMAKTLCKGDLIVVPYNNYLFPAIYIGFGRSIQFFGLWRHAHIDRLEQGLKDGKFYVDYINRNTANVIAKLSMDELDDETLKQYDECWQLLKKYGKI